MFVVTVTFEISDQHLDDFRSAIQRQAQNSVVLEERCRQFDVCFDSEQPQICFLYELYDSREAFNAHLATDHFREFDQLVASWVVTKTVRTWSEHFSGDGNSVDV